MAAQYTPQQLTQFFDELSAEDKKIVKLHVNKKTSKEKELPPENLPFNPKKCHAKLLAEKKDENGVSILHSTDATYHFGMYAYQCTNPAGENGICKNCNKGARLRVCLEKGNTPFGLYSDQNPSKYFTRVSKNKKEKHHYYLHDFGDIPQEHSQYISNEPVQQKNTKKPKKSNPSVSNFDDLYQNVDWNQKLLDDSIHKLSLKELKSYGKKHSLDISGKKEVWVNAITLHLKQSSPESQENTPQQQEQTQDNTPQEQQETQDQLQDTPTQNQDDADTQDPDDITQENDNSVNDLWGSEDENVDDDEIDTVEIQGIIYHNIDGYAHDIDTGDKLGPVDDDVEDWKKAGRVMHAKNLEKKQKNM